MRRRLLNIASAVSLLLCAASGCTWIASYVGPTVGEQTLFMNASYRIILEKGGDIRVKMELAIGFHLALVAAYLNEWHRFDACDYPTGESAAMGRRLVPTMPL